jgi:hypothetical protein
MYRGWLYKRRSAVWKVTRNECERSVKVVECEGGKTISEKFEAE